MSRRIRSFCRPTALASLFALATTACLVRSVHASAPPLPSTLNNWWINTNYAEHGKSVDQIFNFVFWLTTLITVAVQVVLVWLLIKYRHRQGGGKAIYSHGNTRLETIWTLIPAVILIALALWTKRVWDNYRYSPLALDPNTPRILVIGEQFKWNVLYGGPNNKIGRYLVYPKTTDLTWPAVPPGQTFAFPDVKGPAYLPEERAKKVLDQFIQNVNPLGRDYSDPDTNLDAAGDNPDLAKLNDRNAALGRPLVLPKGRGVEIQLGSRDVIHDFFLPNFRTRLDVVPGMRGKLYVTASNDCPGPQLYALEELQSMLDRKMNVMAIVNKNTPGVEYKSPGRRKPKFYRLADKNGDTLLVDGNLITPETVKSAREAGLTKLTATIVYDLVCEELCGAGHATMSGSVIVLDEATLREAPYKNYFSAPGAAPAAASGAKNSAGAASVLADYWPR